MTVIFQKTFWKTCLTKVNFKGFIGLTFLFLLAIGLSLSTNSPKVNAAGTCTWTGGTNNLWSNSGNWTGCPDVSGVPVGSEDLVFPSGASNLSNQNDLPSGLNIQNITLDGGYTITGNSIESLPGSPTSILMASNGNSEIGLDFNLYGGYFSVSPYYNSSQLTLSGALTNTYLLNKGGDGDLKFLNNSSVSIGELYIVSGNVILDNSNFTSNVNLATKTLELSNGSFVNQVNDQNGPNRGNIKVYKGTQTVDTLYLTGSQSEISFEIRGTSLTDYGTIQTPNITNFNASNILFFDGGSGYVPGNNEVYKLINNTSGSAFSGSNLIEGKTVSYGNKIMVLSYIGGDGNDLTATVKTPCKWTGAVSNVWNNAGNWTGSCSGSGGIPGNNDDLVFPSGASNLTSQNNLTSGLNFNSVIVQGNYYTFSGNSFSVSKNFTVDGGKDATVNNVISGTDLNKEGLGDLSLQGNNTYTGQTKIINGKLLAGLLGGVIPDTSNIIVNSNAIFQNFTPNEVVNSISGSGTINLYADLILNSSGSYSYSGSFSGNNLKIENGGTLTLSNAFGGLIDIQVNNGKLILDNSNIYTNLAITSNNSRLQIQNSNIVGGLTYTNGEYIQEINGNTIGNYGSLSVSYQLVLANSSLSLIGSYVPENGEVYKIIDNQTGSAVNGTFSGLSEGSVINFNGENLTISYIGGDGNDVTLSAPTNASTCYWTGDSSDQWSNPGNWSSCNPSAGGVPLNGDSLEFPNGALNKNFNNDLDENYRYTNISVLDYSYIFSGNRLGLTGNFFVDSGYTTTVQSIITGNNFNKTGGGTLYLQGNNSYTGGTNILDGEINVQSGNSIPDRSVVNIGFTGGLSSPSNQETIGGLAGDGFLYGNFRVNQNIDTTFNGQIDALGYQFTKDGTGSLTLTGGVNGYNNIQNNDSGKLVLQGNYINNTIVNNSYAETVLKATSLGGNNFVLNDSSLITVENGITTIYSTINQNYSSNSPVFTFNIDGLSTNDYGSIQPSGNINIDQSVLRLTGSYKPQNGNSFTLIDNLSGNPINGTFKNYPEGSTIYFNGASMQISYVGGPNSDSLVLTATSNASSNNYLPGGLESNGSTLAAWLDASQITGLNNNDTLSQWDDKSGNQNNFTQGNGSYQPTYKTGILNSKSVVGFNGFSQFLTKTNLSFSNGNSDVYVVSNSNSTSFGAQTILANSNPYLGYNLGVFGGKYAVGQTYNLGFSAGEYAVGNWKNVGNEQSFRKNAQSADSTFSVSFGSTNDVNLGVFCDGCGAYLDGNVAEVAIYNRKLNNTEKTILDNYFSTKYAISNTNDKFQFDSDTSNNLVGVGQTSSTDFVLASGNSNGLTLETNGGTSDGSFLIAANDNVAPALTNSDITGIVGNRWATVWGLDKTGTTNAKIGFNFDNYLGGTPLAAENYQVLYRTTNSGNFSSVTSSNSYLVGNKVVFEIANANLQPGFYTIGILNTSPITGADITSASCSPQSGFVGYTTTCSANFSAGKTGTLSFTSGTGSCSTANIGVSATSIGCSFITTTSSSTPFDVTITASGGGTASGGQIIVNDAPSITSVTQNYGGIGGGDTITISGNNFLNGQYQDLKRIGGTGFDSNKGVVADGSGNKYVSGTFSNSVTFGSTTLTSAGSQDIYIAKIDSDGNYLWAVKAGGTTEDGLSRRNSMALDKATGDILLTGYYSGTATFGGTSLVSSGGGANIFITRINPSNGNFIWTDTAGGSTSGLNDNLGFPYQAGSGITSDSSGNIFVSGWFRNNGAFGATTFSETNQTAFVTKLNSSGAFQWAKGFSANQKSLALTIAENSGDLYIGGGFWGNTDFGGTSLDSVTNGDGFIVKLSASDGSLGWAKIVGSDVSGGLNLDGEIVYGLDTDSSGNVYSTGYIIAGNGSDIEFGSSIYNNNSTSQSTVFVAKQDSSGNFTWVNFATASSGANVARDLKVDSSGNAYITGVISGIDDFGSGIYIGNEYSNAFVAKYNSSGTVQFANLVGGTGGGITNNFGIGGNQGRAIFADNSGKVYLGGDFSGTVGIGNTTIASAGDQDAYIVDYQNGSTSVVVGGLPCTNIVYVDSQTLTCTTPSHAAGFVNVVVTNSNGGSFTQTNGYQYVDIGGQIDNAVIISVVCTTPHLGLELADCVITTNLDFSNFSNTSVIKLKMSDGVVLTCPSIPASGLTMNCNGMSVGSIPGTFKPQHNTSGSATTFATADLTTNVVVTNQIVPGQILGLSCSPAYGALGYLATCTATFNAGLTGTITFTSDTGSCTTGTISISESSKSCSFNTTTISPAGPLPFKVYPTTSSGTTTIPATSPTCPSGYTLISENQCQITYSPTAGCPSGYTPISGGQCQISYAPATNCPSGYTNSGGSCTANGVFQGCPSGYTQVSQFNGEYGCFQCGTGYPQTLYVDTSVSGVINYYCYSGANRSSCTPANYVSLSCGQNSAFSANANYRCPNGSIQASNSCSVSPSTSCPQGGSVGGGGQCVNTVSSGNSCPQGGSVGGGGQCVNTVASSGYTCSQGTLSGSGASSICTISSGGSTNKFTTLIVKPGITVTNVNPPAGPTIGGTPITITGTNFETGSNIQTAQVSGPGDTSVRESYLDASNNLYIAGWFEGSMTIQSTTLTSSSTRAGYVAKFNSSGVLQWATKADGNLITEFREVFADTSGNVYISGNFSGNSTFGSFTKTSNGGFDLFAAKLNSSGVFQWATSAGGSNSVIESGSFTTGFPLETLYKIALAADGNILVAGNFEGLNTPFGSTNLSTPASGDQDVLVAKINKTTGSFMQAQSGGCNQLGKPPGTLEGGFAMTTDSSGNIYVGGTLATQDCTFGSIIPTNNFNQQSFVAKLNSSTLAWEWVTSVGNTSPSFDFQQTIFGLVADSNNNIFATGVIGGDQNPSFGSNPTDTLLNGHEFLAKINTSGTWQYVKNFGSPGSLQNAQSELARTLTVDSNDKLYVTGWLGGNGKFDNLYTTYVGGTDAFLAVYNNDGTINYVKSIGNAGDETGRGIEVDSTGKVFLAGNFTQSFLLTNNNLTSVGGSDGFYTKYDITSIGATIGGTSCNNTTFVNSETVTCITPPHTPGFVDVTVFNANGADSGTLQNGYEYQTNALTNANIISVVCVTPKIVNQTTNCVISVNTDFAYLSGIIKIKMSDGSELTCPSLPSSGFSMNCNGLSVGSVAGTFKPQHNASGSGSTYTTASGTTDVVVNTGTTTSVTNANIISVVCDTPKTVSTTTNCVITVDTDFADLSGTIKLKMSDGTELTCPSLPTSGTTMNCNSLSVGSIVGTFKPQHNASGSGATYVTALGTTDVLVQSLSCSLGSGGAVGGGVTLTNLCVNAGSLSIYAGDATANSDICTPADDGNVVEGVSCSVSERSITLPPLSVSAQRQSATTVINDIIFEDLRGLNLSGYSVAATISNLTDSAKAINLGANPDGSSNDTEADQIGTDNQLFATLNPSAGTISILKPDSAQSGLSNYQQGAKTTVKSISTAVTIFQTTGQVIPSRTQISGVGFKYRIPAYVQTGNYTGTITYTVTPS